MARHPWVAKADEGVRFGVQIGAVRRREAPTSWTLRDEPMRILLEAGQLAEQLGFDGLFLHDHPVLSPDPWTGLAALAVVTERVMLGSVVNCIYYRHPALMARLAADLDQLSDGRLMLGLGVGWAEVEFDAYQVPFGSAAERLAGMDDAVAIIRGAWGDEEFTYTGERFSTAGIRISPGPVQQPHLPLMIAGGGERVTLRQVARYADACNLDESGLKSDPGLIRQKLDALQRHCEAVGRAYDEILRTHFVGWLMLAPTEAEVREKVAQYFPDGLPPYFQRFVASGTPEQLAEFYQRRADAGIQYFVAQVLDGTDHETLQLLAEQVAPTIR